MIANRTAVERDNAPAADKIAPWLDLSRSALKTLIVSLAIRGLCPHAVAHWLLQRGGLRDA
jgi:hypothetical protein